MELTPIEATRRKKNELSILGEINKARKNPEGRTAENIAELDQSRRETVLSIWALRSIIDEETAA